MLATPGFHHLHLNSVDPEAAIDFYTRQFPSTSKGNWGGHMALFSPNDVMVLFDKTDRPPAILRISTCACRPAACWGACSTPWRGPAASACGPDSS